MKTNILVKNRSFSFAGAGDVMVKMRSEKLLFEVQNVLGMESCMGPE